MPNENGRPTGGRLGFAKGFSRICVKFARASIHSALTQQAVALERI